MKLSIVLLCLVVLIAAGSVYSRDVVFIGLNGDGAPAAEKTYDRLLREHLSVTPDIQLADYVQSQRYRKQINFSDHPIVSKELIVTMAPYVTDTTYFIWGTIKKCSVTPVRKYFFQAKIKGELLINLNIFSLSNRSFAYAGTIKATTSKHKGLVFFRPVSDMVHVSALDRTELLEKLEYDAVQKTGRMITAIVRSDFSRVGKNADLSKYKIVEVDTLDSHTKSETALPETDSSTTKPKEQEPVSDTDPGNAKTE